jgi:hypothetical protein
MARRKDECYVWGRTLLYEGFYGWRAHAQTKHAFAGKNAKPGGPSPLLYYYELQEEQMRECGPTFDTALPGIPDDDPGRATAPSGGG